MISHSFVFNKIYKIKCNNQYWI